MIKILVPAVAAAIAATTVSAHAATPQLDALFAETEIRRAANLGWENRDEVIQLHADGTFTGVFEKYRQTSGDLTFRYSGSISGRWTVRNGQLCLEGQGLEHKGANCYAVSKGKFAANEYTGRDVRTGDVWEMHVHNRS